MTELTWWLNLGWLIVEVFLYWSIGLGLATAFVDRVAPSRVRSYSGLYVWESGSGDVRRWRRVALAVHWLWPVAILVVVLCATVRVALRVGRWVARVWSDSTWDLSTDLMLWLRAKK